MNNINQIKEQRAKLIRELSHILEIYSAEDFKYWDNLSELEGIVENLKSLREKELNDLGSK